jgi:hypothetical protein
VVKATAAGGGSPAGMASQLAPYTGKKIAQQTQAAASAPPTFRLFPDFLGDSQQPLQPSDPGPLDEGGGGGSGVRFAPPQFPLLGTGQQAPLNFDLFSNGAAATGGGGGVAANGLNGTSI